jgi:hypothetical protein
MRSVFAFFFWLNLTPWLRTARIYYLTSAIHLSRQAIGDLGAWSGAGTVAAALVLLPTVRRMTGPTLVWGSLAASLGMYAAQLCIRDPISAQWGTLALAVCSTIFSAMLVTMTMRVCGSGTEGVMVGLVAATAVVASDLADISGSFLFDALGPAHGNTIAASWRITNEIAMACTALGVGFIPFMPAWARKSGPPNANRGSSLTTPF